MSGPYFYYFFCTALSFKCPIKSWSICQVPKFPEPCGYLAAHIFSGLQVRSLYVQCLVIPVVPTFPMPKMSSAYISRALWFQCCTSQHLYFQYPVRQDSIKPCSAILVLVPLFPVPYKLDLYIPSTRFQWPISLVPIISKPCHLNLLLSFVPYISSII